MVTITCEDGIDMLHMPLIDGLHMLDTIHENMLQMLYRKHTEQEIERILSLIKLGWMTEYSKKR